MKKKYKIIILLTLFIFIFIKIGDYKQLSRLNNDEYCKNQIINQIPEYDNVQLDPVRKTSEYNSDLKNLISHFTKENPNYVRWFIAYQIDPEINIQNEENHFYTGFITGSGNVVIVTYDSLLV